MSQLKDILVPDLGDFENVPVIEVLVAPGDRVEKEQPLITLESDKATMEIPSPYAGKIAEVLVSEGQSVSPGSLIATVRITGSWRRARRLHGGFPGRRPWAQSHPGGALPEPWRGVP